MEFLPNGNLTNSQWKEPLFKIVDANTRGDPYAVALTHLELWWKNYSYLIFHIVP